MRATAAAPIETISENPAPRPSQASAPKMSINSFEELVALCGEKRELVIKHALESHVSPMSFADGRMEIALTPDGDPNIAQELSRRLKEWTNNSWFITISKQQATDTIRQKRDREAQEKQDRAKQDPSVKAILNAFPGAQIVNEKSLVDDEPSAPQWPDDGEKDEGIDE